MLISVLRVGMEMRAAQARYFKSPRDSDERRDALRQSVSLERKFDAMAATALRRVEEPPA